MKAWTLPGLGEKRYQPKDKLFYDTGTSSKTLVGDSPPCLDTFDQPRVFTDSPCFCPRVNLECFGRTTMAPTGKRAEGGFVIIYSLSQECVPEQWECTSEQEDKSFPCDALDVVGRLSLGKRQQQQK